MKRNMFNRDARLSGIVWWILGGFSLAASLLVLTTIVAVKELACASNDG
jgi:hypothetical protein